VALAVAFVALLVCVGIPPVGENPRAEREVRKKRPLLLGDTNLVPKKVGALCRASNAVFAGRVAQPIWSGPVDRPGVSFGSCIFGACVSGMER